MCAKEYFRDHRKESKCDLRGANRLSLQSFVLKQLFSNLVRTQVAAASKGGWVVETINSTNITRYFQ
jgi:hypothetical protein